MISINKLKFKILKLNKYFKNRKFREEIKREKSKKYLYSKTERKVNFFDFYKARKNNFSNIVNLLGENTKKYRLYFLTLGIVLLSLTSYIVFISPYFKISPSKVIIERLDTLTDINIAYKSIEPVYGKSIFLINKQEISNSLKSMQKNLKNIDVSRLFPNGLKIILESYKEEFYTKFSGIEKSYIVSSNGVLIYEKNINKELYNLEIIDQNLLESGFFDYKEGVNEDVMKKIIFTRDGFLKLFPNKNIAKLAYFKIENELHLSLDTGTIIIFELNNDLNKQLALLKFYNDTNKDILSSGELSYLDIRIIGKIFICKEKNKCKKNLIRIYGEFYK